MSEGQTPQQQANTVEYFLQDIEHHGRNERTAAAYQRVLTDYESFLAERFEKAPPEASYRDCMAWIHELRSTHSESTVATYASYLNRFYSYLERVGHTDENPMTVVLEEMSESIESNPTRRDITLPEMRSFVADVRHPLHRAIVVTLLKTGIRAGELCNLDLIDCHLEHEAQTWQPRAHIAGRPDSLFVSTEHTYGEESGGERRTASNKRKRETVIPIDDELKEVLVRWLAVRPDVAGDSRTPSAAATEPLFVGTADSWGQRLTPNVVHHVVEQYARERGWYRTGGGASENVTPHYFRHFFTTHLRDRTGDRGIVQYLRGDVASDVIDTYTHNWGDRVRETYLEHIYSVAP
ncbi:tyrosine-type recombinase/integrase [Halopiger xanaduensis]|uniref:Integrase family protein n=1 Tax=Halopiger xanaduensis (strain DSM 18323 / JCM 14033 / SH-6) TaxID=797210 RepID=F8D845_HALXS|nr:tyrosine-type recombinase/integrase [Halopiger xanaduensis]AEH37938.1 integrase family protein [Halopiger xanaduensis SH-6]